MEVKDQIYGFEVKAKNYVKEAGGNICELEHVQTGAQVIVVENQDEKKSFLIGFRTIPEDHTGVFHILEHSVLNGSKKYPDKDTFVNLMKHSMAEFVNAITYPDHTVYPFCTENEKDFMNLMDVYLNAVFSPNVLTDRTIFEQEGWHVQNTEDGSSEVSGVVYNEMKGVFSSLDSVLMYDTFETLFPENAYRFVSGGNPEAIPSLSYETFLERYRKFYSASNCCIVLYGKMNVEEKLEYINKAYLSKMCRTESVPPEGEHRPVNVKRCSNYDKETFGNQGTFAAFNYSLGDFSDRERMTAVYILLLALMGENEAPLKKELLQALGLPDIQYYIMDGIGQPYLSFTIKNVEKETAHQVKQVLEETAEKLCREGIGEKLLVSAMNRQEFRRREKGGYAPNGIEDALDIAVGWTLGVNPSKILEYEEIYANLQKKISEGYFEHLLKEMLLENPYHTEVYLEPEEEKEELSKLTLSDLEKEQAVPQTVVQEEKGTIYLRHDVASKGVAYQSYYFDISDLTPEDVPYARLLSEVLGEVPTNRHSLEEFLIEKNTWLGNMSTYLDAYTNENDSEKVHLKFVLDVSSLEKNIWKSVELVEELLFDSILNDTDIIRKKILQSRMALEQGFISSGNSYASGRASAHHLLEAVARERFQGIEYYYFLNDLLKQFDVCSDHVIEKLKDIREKICRMAPVTVSYAGEAESNLLFREALRSSAVSKQKRNNDSEWYQDELLRGGNEAFMIPSEVSYVALGGKGAYTGEGYLLGRIISYDYLWKKVRAEGGAYGCGMSVGVNGCWTMNSYRDPNVRTTCDTFCNTSGWVQALEMSDEELLNYKIGAVARYDRLPKAYGQAKQMDAWYLREEKAETREAVREQILNVSKEELKNRAAALEAFALEGTLCVLGNKEKVEEARDKFGMVSVLMEI
ncbi:MAG: insulinase family protein [bacterium]|nr:insulinase family protein [bacterium]